MEPFDCIELAQHDSGAIVKFKDKRVMDPARIEKLGKELNHLAESQDESMTIDFDNVKFISSAAISKLIVLDKRMKSRGTKLALRNLQPEVRDLFNLAKLDTIFDILD